MRQRLNNKKILLGVSGSIAAYKACLILRLLQKEGADVRVVMTEAAQKFVAPLTFETLSGAEVVLTLFPEFKTERTRHIKLAEWADCILVAPATANLIAKVHSGIADDFLSTVITAARGKVVFAPAMDYEMAANKIYLRNCFDLARLGYVFIDSEEGILASGASGPGRLADPEKIVDVVAAEIAIRPDWQNKKVLITAGPTREDIDPVRTITNYSSGKMGFALAEAAFYRGAEVSLVCGPVHLKTPYGVHSYRVKSAGDMADVVKQLWESNDVLIMAAAVADYAPEISSEKIKKKNASLELKLERTEDILANCSRSKDGRVVVGFALETKNGLKNARKKLQNKNLDMICLNSPRDEGSGFEVDTIKLTLLTQNKEKPEKFPLMQKHEAADVILDTIDQLLKGRDF